MKNEILLRKATYLEKVKLKYEEQCTKKLAETANVGSRLMEDMRRMVNNPEYSDITFMCQDKVPVVACRLLLVARSPVFRKLLMNGMAESRQSVIQMPQVTSSVLLIIIEYLYVGDIPKEVFGDSFMQWDKVFGVISATRFFMLDNLESIACDLLWTELTRITVLPYKNDVMQLFCFKLTIACEFTELLMDDDHNLTHLDIVCLELVECLQSAQLTGDHLQILSSPAFSYYMRNTQSKDEGNGAISFGEYVKLRQLVMWWNSQLPKADQLEHMDSYLPDTSTVMLLVADRQSLKRFKADVNLKEFDSWWKKITDSFTKASIHEWQSLITLSHIHPVIVVGLIHPLNMFKLEDLFEPMAIHAGLRFIPRPNLRRVYSWRFHAGSQYAVGPDYSLRRNFGPGPELQTAVCDLAIPPYGIYEWSISLTNDLRDMPIVGMVGFYKELGTRIDKAVLPPLDNDLGYLLPSSWGLSLFEGSTATSRTSCDDIATSSWQLTPGKIFGKQSKTINVLLNRFDNTCSFSYDGQSSGTIWRDLPHGIIYPAVSLRKSLPKHSRSASSRNSGIRLQFVRGSEYL